MAATKPKQNLEADCILAAQAGCQLAQVKAAQPLRDRAAGPAITFSTLLAEAAKNWAKPTTRSQRRLLWAVQQFTPTVAQAEVAQSARAHSIRIFSAARGELSQAETVAAKMFCLHMSNELGLKSQTLSFN